MSEFRNERTRNIRTSDIRISRSEDTLHIFEPFHLDSYRNKETWKVESISIRLVQIHQSWDVAIDKKRWTGHSIQWTEVFVWEVREQWIRSD